MFVPPRDLINVSLNKMSNQYGDFTISKRFLTVNVRDKRTRCYSYENTYINELKSHISIFVLVSPSRIMTYSLLNWSKVYISHWSAVFWMSLGIIPFSKVFLTVLFVTLTNNVSFLFLFLIKHLFKCVALLCIYMRALASSLWYKMST